jgi:hypothetical protein
VPEGTRTLRHRKRVTQKPSALVSACRATASLPRPQRPCVSAPVHTCAKFSYLSSERITKMQHSGLINLGIVIILATNSRLILENITKYGLRATPLTWLQRAISVSTSSNRHTLVGFIGLFGCVLAAWAIEVVGKKRLECALSHVSCRTASMQLLGLLLNVLNVLLPRIRPSMFATQACYEILINH